MITITRPSGQIVSVACVSVQTRSTPTQTTGHTVEDGADFANHLRKVAEGYTWEAHLSEDEPYLDQPHGSRIAAALSDLRACHGEVCTISTLRDETLERVSVSITARTQGNINAARVTITAQELRIATSASVTIPPEQPAPAASPGLADEQDTGQQPTDDPESTEEAADASYLYDLIYGDGWV